MAHPAQPAPPHHYGSKIGADSHIHTSPDTVSHTHLHSPQYGPLHNFTDNQTAILIFMAHNMGPSTSSPTTRHNQSGQTFTAHKITSSLLHSPHNHPTSHLHSPQNHCPSHLHSPQNCPLLHTPAAHLAPSASSGWPQSHPVCICRGGIKVSSKTGIRRYPSPTVIA